jgi:hypothetical protein
LKFDAFPIPVVALYLYVLICMYKYLVIVNFTNFFSPQFFAKIGQSQKIPALWYEIYRDFIREKILIFVATVVTFYIQRFVPS